MNDSGIGRWALAGVALYVLGGLVMLFVSLWIAEAFLTAIGVDSSAGTVGLSIRNAAHPIGWGASVAFVAAVIGQRSVAGIRFGASGWVVLGIGLILASATTFLDIEFVRASHGVYDFEYGGVSGLAGSALVAVALAAWAALAVPPANGGLLWALAIAAGGGLIALLIPSAGGAADGIAPEHVPIALTFVADTGYVAWVAVAAARALRSRGT
jgi:hypothetical protein